MQFLALAQSQSNSSSAKAQFVFPSGHAERLYSRNQYNMVTNNLWKKSDSEFVEMALDPSKRKLLLKKLSQRRNQITIVAYLMLTALFIMVVLEIISDDTSYFSVVMPFVILFYSLSRMELISSKIQMLKVYDSFSNKN